MSANDLVVLVSGMFRCVIFTVFICANNCVHLEIDPRIIIK